MKYAFIILLAFLLFSCVPKGKPKYRPPPRSRSPAITAPSSSSAERTASLTLIEKGETAMEEGNLDHAEDVFQESIQVDPGNGVGYYYLALVKTRLGKAEEAEGLLEKALQLLGNEPSWLEKLQALQEELGAN